MERGFYNEDLEELLKQKADQYKMYPSDRVWKGIHRSLHPNRKWYWLSLFVFLSAIGYYTFIEFITPGVNKPVTAPAPATSIAKQSESTELAESAGEKAVIVPFGTPHKQSGPQGPVSKHNAFILNLNNNTDNNEITANNDQPIQTVNDITDNGLTASPSETPVMDLKASRRLRDLLNEGLPGNNLLFLQTAHNGQQANNGLMASHALAKAPAADARQLIPAIQNEQEDSRRANWQQNLAVYELKVPSLKRLSWQFSFTPTMSYRTLAAGEANSSTKTVPLAPDIQGSLNNLVNHKPALGFEAGSNMLYALNKTFTLKAGLLFNYSRYDIQAYSSPSPEQATIALNTGYGLSVDAITTYTNIRNFTGDHVENLRNQYFQLSVPLGLEVKVLGSEKLQLGVGGTVQPTYLMNRNIYLISTDYKNYTTEPSLMRRWNVNTSVEAFVSYKTGDLKWQVGPQLRYQLLSSYIKEYPIREHLMEYGIKIGVAKTIR